MVLRVCFKEKNMNKIKLRHDKFIVCPYAKNGCNHPRCIHMTGQECYLKNNNVRGKIKNTNRFIRRNKHGKETKHSTN